MDMRPNSRTGLADLSSIIYLGAVWGAAFLFFRVASPEVGPIWTAELRIALAGAILAACIGPRRVWALRHHAGRLVILGATFSAIPFSLLAFATLTLPSSLASLLMATTPLFTALVGAAWLRQRPTRRVVAGLGVGFTAVLLLLGGGATVSGPAALAAVAAGLLAAFSYAVAGTYAHRAFAGVEPLDLATGQLLGGAAVLLPVALQSGAPGVPALDGAVSILLVAVVSTAIAWPVYFRIAARTNATSASTPTFLVPMFGMAWGSLLLGEPIGPRLLAAFGLVIVGLILVLPLPLAVARGRLTEALRGGRARPATAASRDLAPS